MKLRAREGSYNDWYEWGLNNFCLQGIHLLLSKGRKQQITYICIVWELAIQFYSLN